MSQYVVKKTPGDTSWFLHDRFGMFFHWGLYSMPARHEWCKSRDVSARNNYDKYFKYFDPDMYDPKQWAKDAKNAGMKYAVFTTKHHEGFCMFDSKYTDYKCTNTPAGRDLLREFVDAFRAEGLRIGFYYSLIDWHHPDFVIDQIHPLRDEPNVKELNEKRDMSRYAQYMRNQVTELLTNYGKIDVLFLDLSYRYQEGKPYPYNLGKMKDDWEAEKLIDTIRSLQPDILINNRTQVLQDIWTPEQFQPTQWVKDKETGELVPWESCQTFSGSWGYYRDENTWKSPQMMIEMLINMVSLGGNLIMNVGPNSRGCFDHRAQAALQAYGDWMKYNSRSIYGCTMADPELLAACPDGCRMTQSMDGKRLYLHLMVYPFKCIQLPGLKGKVDYAQFLHDGSELIFKEDVSVTIMEGTTWETYDAVLELPVQKPNVLVPVVELILK